MSIADLESSIETVYYNDEYIKFIEDNIRFFNNPTDLKLIPVEPAKAYKYEGDFYGLLSHLNIPLHHHYLMMRLNGYDSPTEYKGDTKSIVIYIGGNEVALARALTTRVR